jgi:hypothetical protein
MLQVLHWFSYTVAVLDPLALLLAWRHRQRHPHVVLAWRKPHLAVVSIVGFILGLGLFVAGCIFLLSGLQPAVNDAESVIASRSFFPLAADAFLLLFALATAYLAVQHYQTQYVTEKGIALDHFNWASFRWELEWVTWPDLRDYYTQSDYPITVFNLLCVDAAGYTVRHSIRVPHHLRNRFEAILEAALEHRRFVRPITRNQQSSAAAEVSN